MPSFHCIRAGALAASIAAAAAARAQELPLPPVQLPSAASFTVFVKSVPVGSEQIAIRRGADGWTIVSSGRMGAPIDIVARRVQARYTEQWRPLELTVDATVRGQLLSIQSVVAGASAQTHTVNGALSSDRTAQMPPDALLLPSPFWGPFAARAPRLYRHDRAPRLHEPVGRLNLLGGGVAEQIQTADRLVQARRTV